METSTHHSTKVHIIGDSAELSKHAPADSSETMRRVAENLLDTALADLWRDDSARTKKGAANSQHRAS